MRYLVLASAVAVALSPAVVPAPAFALGIRAGGAPGIGLIGGPVFRGGPASASRPTTFSDFGIAGRGLGPVGAGRGVLAGEPGGGRPNGGRDGFGYGGAGSGGFYGGYGLALGDGYGSGGGATKTCVPAPPPP